MKAEVWNELDDTIKEFSTVEKALRYADMIVVAHRHDEMSQISFECRFAGLSDDGKVAYFGLHLE